MAQVATTGSVHGRGTSTWWCDWGGGGRERGGVVGAAKCATRSRALCAYARREEANEAVKGKVFSRWGGEDSFSPSLGRVTQWAKRGFEETHSGSRGWVASAGGVQLGALRMR